MVLINIGSLSENELRNIASQEAAARETIMIGINDLMHGEISGKAKSFMKFTPVLFIFCYLGSMKLSRLFYIKGAESGTE